MWFVLKCRYSGQDREGINVVIKIYVLITISVVYSKWLSYSVSIRVAMSNHLKGKAKAKDNAAVSYLVFSVELQLFH
jgi:hypothetical protein